MNAVEPTVAELEEAITHVAATAGRTLRWEPRWVTLHEEINHLLDDRELAKRALQNRINEGLRRMNGSGKLVTNEEAGP